MKPHKKQACQIQHPNSSMEEKRCGRREFLKGSVGLAAAGGAAMLTGCSSGLPIGIQLQGPHFQEGELLKCGFNLEKGLNLDRRLPSISV